MKEATEHLGGRGFYSVPEASRLTDLPVSTIKRCTHGYTYALVRGTGISGPSFESDMVAERAEGNREILSFLDLIELRMVKLFRLLGVSGEEIREAQRVARDRLQTTHPFSTGRFRTYGTRIVMEAGKELGSKRLVEIARSQELMTEIILPFTKEVRFEGSKPVLWTHPRGNSLVVLDPTRSFGHPIVKESGVPTYILAEAASSWGPLEEVARWYEVRVDEVRAALAFERRSAAA